jgi:drug/metabolite transporter (DMT)-like permease
VPNGSHRVATQGILLIVLLTFVWGMNWPSIRTAVTEISPWTFRAVCLFMGSLSLFALLVLRGGRLSVSRSEWGPLILVGLFNVTAYQMFTAYGLQLVEAGRGVILAFTFSLWSVLLGAVFLREALTPSRLTALALGLGAIALLLGPDIAALGRTLWGGLLLIGSAVSWAVATILVKRRDWILDPGELAAWQVLIGGAPVVAGALIFDPLPDFTTLSTKAIVALVYSSAIAVAFGQWAWFRVLKIMPAAVASISMLAVPVIGVFSSALLLGEAVTAAELGALALVCAALWLVLVRR